MKRAFPFLLALLLLAGCSCSLPQSNQPPEACIDDISPLESSVGDIVSFSGHGTSADGDMVAYRWHSDQDGELSTASAFQISSLSAGEHVISLKVQDNNDAWSPEVRLTITVLAAPQAPADIESFTASPETIEEGGSATLSWEVTNSTDVSINRGIGNVQPTGSASVSPSSTTTYTITARGAGPVATAQVTVHVEEPGLQIVFFEADPGAVLSGKISTLRWETTGATEVRIVPLIGVVEAVGSVEITPAGEQTHTFTLIVTDGEETISEDVEVESYFIMPAHLIPFVPPLVMPDSHTMVFQAILSGSGCVPKVGLPDNFICVGDDTGDIAIQAFLTFDISLLPDDAVVESVDVDFSNHSTTYGTPFADLGCLRAYVDDFGSFGSGHYFKGTPVDAIGRWCDVDELEEVESNAAFADALEEKLEDGCFQIRLQFNDHETDGNGDNDMLRWTPPDLPTLVVVYYSDE